MSSEARKERSLNTVKRLVSAYDEHLAKSRDKRKTADEAVVLAIKEGATWREIATATGRSVSWVQAVVARTAPELIKKKPEAEVGSE
jgi:transposase